jgi:hypothetical protein
MASVTTRKSGKDDFVRNQWILKDVALPSVPSAQYGAPPVPRLPFPEKQEY